MDNILITETDTELTLTINKTKDFGPTSTGKSLMVATSHGWVALPNGLKLSLNIVRPKKKG